MSQTWQVKCKNGKVFPALSREEIQEHIRTGEIKPSDQATHQGLNGVWVPVEEILTTDPVLSLFETLQRVKQRDPNRKDSFDFQVTAVTKKSTPINAVAIAIASAVLIAVIVLAFNLKKITDTATGSSEPQIVNRVQVPPPRTQAPVFKITTTSTTMRTVPTTQYSREDQFDNERREDEMMNAPPPQPPPYQPYPPPGGDPNLVPGQQNAYPDQPDQRPADNLSN